MPPELPWDPVDILISTAAATAVAEVQDALRNHASQLGRSGIIATLRAQSRELAQSSFGRDQIRSLAFDVAADDVAWGRAPLTQWRTFALDATAIPDEVRGQLRAALPEADEAVGREIAHEIEREALSKGDAFDAIGALAGELISAAELQAALWDDPRIAATPDTRSKMRASVEPLRRRADAFRISARPAAVSSPKTPPTGLWRRLLALR